PFLSGCKSHPAAPPAIPVSEPPALLAARAAWRAEQDRTMRGELSPLGRVDYVHLPAGEHVIESSTAATSILHLSPQALSPYRGELRLHVQPARFSFTAAPPIWLNGALAATGDLKDRDVLAIGRLRLAASGLHKDPSLAIYDLEAPARRAYTGLH